MFLFGESVLILSHEFFILYIFQHINTDKYIKYRIRTYNSEIIYSYDKERGVHKSLPNPN